MTPREIIAAQINHREMRPVPYTMGYENEVGEALTRHYGSDEWQQRLTRFMTMVGGMSIRMESATDDVHSTDIFGGVWRHDQIPMHMVTPAMSEPSFDNYEFPSLEPFLKAAEEAREYAMNEIPEYPDTYTMMGIGWGLFETSWCIRGFENALIDSMTEPDFFEELLDRLTEIFLAIVETWKDVPVDAYFFSDDWGEQRGVIVGPERWRKLLKPRWAKIYDAAHAHGKKCLSHCCGSVADIMPDIIEIGLDVLESVQPEARGMNPYELKKDWGDKISFWGCIGSQSTLSFGTPEEITAEIAHLCAEVGRGGGFIVAPAKPLHNGMPTENAVAVLEAFTNQK